MFWLKEEGSNPEKNVLTLKKNVSVLKQCSSQRREEEKNSGSVKEGSRSWRSASVLGKVYGHGNNIFSQITFIFWCLGPQEGVDILIGSLEDSGDISIKFDFVNIKVHVLRPYPENFRSFELYPFFLFHQGGMGPALSYCARLEMLSHLIKMLPLKTDSTYLK